VPHSSVVGKHIGLDKFGGKHHVTVLHGEGLR